MLSTLDRTEAREIISTLKSVLNGNSVGEVSQIYVTSLYKSLKPELVLSRVFVTMPFEKLEERSQKRCQELAKRKGLKDSLTDQTPVLSLVGSAGVEEAWNDCQLSKAHSAFPLLSQQSPQRPS